MLAILGIVAWVVTPAYAAHYVPRLHDHFTLHITPNDLGGYDITEVPFHFDNDLGAKLDLADADTYHPSAQVNFPFPFFGTTYPSLFVMDDGVISMEQSLDYHDLQYHFSSQPVILPLLLDLAPDPASPRAVYLKRQADRLIVTYDHVPAFHQPQDLYTFQVVLYSNGQFEITYNGLPKSIQYQVDDNPLATLWAIGFKSANGSPRTADFFSPPLASGRSGLIQDEFLSFRTYIHLFLVPLALSILTSSLILIVGIPLLLRFTLLHPLNALLEGVQAMNRGKHGITIPVEANDEIGYLTESFNHMSAQLNDLITSLEHRVTDRTSALRESEKQYRELFDLESDAIFIIRNSDGQILQANNAAVQLYGFSLAEILSKRNTGLSAEPEETQKATNSPVPSDQIVRIPLRWHRKKNGEVFPVSITARFIEWKGESVHLAAIRDITEQYRIEQELVALATTDSLTGLYNRRHFLTLAEQVFTHGTQSKMEAALLLMDLDHFKLVNDQFGHETGDVVLKHLAALLNARIRVNDILARYGGEEFIILLPRTGREEAFQIAERLRSEIENLEITFGDATISITASIGVAAANPTDTVDTLLRRADKALYAAKQAGRNCCELWKAGL